MIRKLSDLKLTDSYRGVNKGKFFLVPIKCFGKECTRLYKVFGFEGNEVYVQRIDKRSGKIPNKAPILETFNFDVIFKVNNPSF